MTEPGRRMFPVVAGQPFETWQVATVRLPIWMPKDGKPTRQWVAVCLQEGPGEILVSELGSQEEVPRLLESVLSQAGRDWRSRPARVEVSDPEVARTLEVLLSPQGVTVAQLAELPELRQVTNGLAADLARDDPRPSPLVGAGVTVERLRAFARAARELYASPVWRHLTGYDLAEVEAPKVEGFRCFILSRRGRASLRGLMFFPSRADYDQLTMNLEPGSARTLPKPFWALEYEPAWTTPPSDLDLWERFGLPWAGEDRCPVAYLMNPEEAQRPDARQLAFLEGVLAALAATSEPELDSGRWKKTVSTADGEMQLILFLPAILDPEEAPFRPEFAWVANERVLRQLHKRLRSGEFKSIDEANEILGRSLAAGLLPSEPETLEEEAEELAARAWETPGRRAILLAREALKIWPDCADAYNLLAAKAPDPEAARELYSQAVAAGKRALGSELFQQAAGRFWGLIETRPYMRGLEGLAVTLLELDRFAEAVELFQEMLRLNPNDNQGVRDSLVHVLIALDRDAEAEELLNEYQEDRSALLAYPRALLRFRREGDSLETRRYLKRALQANRFVPALLLGSPRPAHDAPMYAPGSQEEAAVYLRDSHGSWEKTSAALDWLKKHAGPPVRPPAKGRPAAPRRKKKRRR
jgi:tetratricopeptide (TPR) repeat protein